MLATHNIRICTLCDNEKINAPDLIESRTLRIGNFAAQIENDPGGLIPGTMAERMISVKFCA